MKIKILFDTDFKLSVSLLQTDFVLRWTKLLENEIAEQTLMHDDTYSSLMSESQSRLCLEQAIEKVNKFLQVEFIKIPTTQDYEDKNFYNQLHQQFEKLAGSDWDKPTRLMILAPDSVKLAVKHINRFCHRLERRPYTIDPFMRIEFNTHRKESFLPQDYDLFESVDFDNTVVLDYSTLGKSLYECFEDGLGIDYPALRNQEHYCANFVLRFGPPSKNLSKRQEFLNWCAEQGIKEIPKSAVGSIKLGKIDQANSFEHIKKTAKIVNITLERT